MQKRFFLGGGGGEAGDFWGEAYPQPPPTPLDEALIDFLLRNIVSYPVLHSMLQFARRTEELPLGGVCRAPRSCV